MKSFYIFLSLVGILLLSNNTAFAQNQESNEKVVHKAIDKMNYEFAIAVLKRINEVDNTVKFVENKEVKDTTFSKVTKLKPTIQAKSLDRIFSKEKMSDGVAGYIYDIDFIKLSSKSYPTDDLSSTITSLDKIVNKVIARTNDFGDKQSKFKLTPKQLSDLKLRLAKIKNSAVSSLNSNEKTELPKEKTEIKIDSTKQDSTTKTEEPTQIDSSEIIYYKINQDEEKQLTGINETTEGEKPTYKFGLDIKKSDSIQIRVKGNAALDTAFLVANANNSLILEGEKNRYIIDLNIATTQEDDYMMWIIFGVIAVSVIAFVMYKQSQKDKPTTPKQPQKDIVKKDPLSRDNVVVNTASSTNQKTENGDDTKRQTILAQNQIDNQINEEKSRLTAILTNSNLSDEQKLKEAKSENIALEVANHAEIQELMRVIGELSTKTKVENTEKESIKDQENTTTQKVETPPKNTITQQKPLYVSLSDIGENGISSERTKGMSNSIFVIRPYSEGENEAKKADLMLHSDIKDMAFESIFRSIEKLDHIIEHSTFSESAKKITQEEKGELIKEDNVWKVKKRLKVKFS
ncbi:hypothetical protein ACE193_12315 [Bernardetia sp. OM2101]|uniref:hypothetical protein n=1 Tax=Bernardetia sp. OM2101 TaxID=3344876 RepID=UPI0035CF3B29